MTAGVNGLWKGIGDCGYGVVEIGQQREEGVENVKRNGDLDNTDHDNNLSFRWIEYTINPLRKRKRASYYLRSRVVVLFRVRVRVVRNRRVIRFRNALARCRVALRCAFDFRAIFRIEHRTNNVVLRCRENP